MAPVAIFIGIILASTLCNLFHPKNMLQKLLYVLGLPLAFDLFWFCVLCIIHGGAMYFVGAGCVVPFIGSLGYILVAFFTFRIKKGEKSEEENKAEKQ